MINNSDNQIGRTIVIKNNKNKTGDCTHLKIYIYIYIYLYIYI